MAIEIERKFLVADESWKQHAGKGKLYRQGYLAKEKMTVRVRTAGDKGFLTIKSRGNGISRDEFEYEIPFGDALQLLGTCADVIVKTRHLVQHEGHTWEVDVFSGENEGLVVAEIELKREDETFALPAWAGEEVTHDKRYSNASLCTRPWTTWER